MMNDETQFLSSDVLDDEIDEDPAQDAFTSALTDHELRRRVKRLVERWRLRGTSVAKAYAYELENMTR